MAKRKYGLTEHREAAMAYIITGTYKGASKLAGIPRTTIRDWSQEDWWSDAITDARKRKNNELDACLTNVIHKAIHGASEALDRGDAIKMKENGQDVIKYKPMTGKDQALTAAILIDKRAALRGDPSRITKTTADSADLTNMRKALELVAKQAEKQYTPVEEKEEEPEVIKH